MKIPVRIVRKRCSSSTANRGHVSAARPDMSVPATTEAESKRYATIPADRAKYQTVGLMRRARFRGPALWTNGGSRGRLASPGTHARGSCGKALRRQPPPGLVEMDCGAV